MKQMKILYVKKKIESLEFRHIEKLNIKRLVEDDLYGKGFTQKDEILEGLSEFTKGRIAVVCAPEYVIGKARSLLSNDLKYPLDDIITIVTSS